MNGEVSLIVKKSIEAPGGIIDSASGYVTAFTSPQAAFVGAQDFTPYIGKFVHIFENYTPTDWGFHKITNVIWDGTWSEIFTDTPWNFYAFPTQGSAAFQVHDVISATEDAYLDLYENESISQNWQYTDLNNFTSLGAFSREFRIPFSDRNQEALGPLFDVNFSAGTDNFFHYKLPAEIRVDTLPIASGYIRVRKVYKQRNKISEVELAFYAETPDLFKAIGEKKLKDIVDLPSLNEIVTFDNVTNNLDERIWTLLDRGQLWSEGGQQGTRRINNPATPLYASDLTPAVSWWYLLSNIIADAGFELDAGSLEGILQTYWMPWLNNFELQTDDLGPQYFFRAYNSGAVTLPATGSGAISAEYIYSTLTESFDNNANFDPSTGIYTAPGGGRYTFHVTLSMQSLMYTGVGTTTNLKVYFKINGVGVPTYSDNYWYQDYTTIDFQRGFDLQAGDTVELAIKYEIQSASGVGTGTAQVSILAGTGNLGNSLFEIIGTRFNYGQGYLYQNNAPDVKQIDIVSDIIKMHNCAIVPDRINPSKISIVPYNSYVGSGDVIDWTPKMDIDKDITIYSTAEIQKQKTLFTYSAGEDYLSKVYKGVGRIYGQYSAEGYTINPTTEPSDFLSGTNSVQLVTQSTPCGYVDSTDVIIPQFINDNNEFIQPFARCLFNAATPSIQLYNDGINAVATTGVPTLNNYSIVNPTISDSDLNWNPEVPPFLITANPYNNLFNQYWRIAFNELYSPDARIMEAYFALDIADILTFKFSDIIIIENARWRILEIQDYKVGQFESTKVKLIKYLKSEADCSGRPYTINENGTVNFVDVNDNPVTATQSCCTRYGYNWDEGTGECFAFQNSGDRPTSGVTGTNTNPILRGVITGAVNGNTRSVQQGVELQLVEGNNNTIAVGDTIKLDEQVRGNAMFGKNVYTKQPGFHLGGGWTLDDRSQAEGGHQYGIILFGSKDALAASGDIIQPTIENTGVHLSMVDDSYWSVLLHINVTDIATNTVYNGLHMVTLQKQGGTAYTTGAILITEDNGFGTVNFAINIDVATVTSEHRIEIITTGTGYPYIFHTTVTLQYTAVR